MFHGLKLLFAFCFLIADCLYQIGCWLLFYGCLLGTVLRQQLERSGASFVKVHAGNSANRGMKSQLNAVSIMLLAGFHFSMFLFSRRLAILILGESLIFGWRVPGRTVLWTPVQFSLCKNTRDSAGED